jgi:hypothetical protein
LSPAGSFAIARSRTSILKPRRNSALIMFHRGRYKDFGLRVQYSPKSMKLCALDPCVCHWTTRHYPGSPKFSMALWVRRS